MPAVGPVAGFLAAIVGCNLLCRQCVGMMLIIRSRMRLPAGAISLVRLRHRPLAAFGAWLPRFPVKRDARTPLNLPRRLTETEGPPPIRGPATLANASAWAYNIQLLASSFVAIAYQTYAYDLPMPWSGDALLST